MWSVSRFGLCKSWNYRSCYRMRKGLACIAILLILSTLVISSWIYRIGKFREWNIYRLKCLDFLETYPFVTERAHHEPSEIFYISHNFHSGMGLGNQMFIYAAMWVLAHRNNLTIAIAPNKLHSDMRIDRRTVGSFDLSDCRNLVFGKEELSIYDQRADSLLFANAHSRRNVSLWSYFQSFRYFHPLYRDDIRREFSLQHVAHRAQLARKQVLEKIYQKLSPNETRTRPVIGIHIRRGDILTPWWQSVGMVEIPASYFVNAARFIQSKGIVDPVYIVCTNDPEWAEENLPFRLMGVVRNESPEVDMAVLAQSNHLIISYGTFSFWAAYLSNATNVVYFADYPRPGSEIAKVTNLSDYWLPEWVAMSG